MNTSKAYLLRWCGVELGSFPLGSIEQMLDQGKICLWHEVLLDQTWGTVEELLKSTSLQDLTSKSVEAKRRGKPGTRMLPRLNTRADGET